MDASEFQRLAPILGATAPIPDILIYDRLEPGQRGDQKDALRLHLLIHLPQTTTDTLLVVWRKSTAVSHPCGPASPEWESFPFDLPPGPFLVKAFAVIVQAAVYLLIVLVYCCVFLGWGFCRVFGPGWLTEKRIIDDILPDLRTPIRRNRFRGELHIQRLSTKYTLVTCKDSGPWHQFEIHPLRGVPDSVYSAFLASIDIQFMDVTVKPKSNVTLAQLVTFVARQENLRTLACAPPLLLASIRNGRRCPLGYACGPVAVQHLRERRARRGGA
ncbi:hypothetical protein FB45DRAFT_890172 [Roridomyces roridus]|uniref:Uncharacterized protein n=1 Tax=Roridomyces roridus TaxID=1738132 RepID=A0AAD7G2Z5_9AGAR|nr:hypothetical protein FB45DRAFT_890172 [Roridomyces roridus]